MIEIFDQVRKLLDAADYEKALSLLNEVKSNTINKAEAYRMLGYVHYQMRDFDKSIENSTKSIDLCELGFMETTMAHYFRGRAAADSLNYRLAISDCWSLLKFAETDSDCLDDAFDIIEILLNSNLSKLSSQIKLELEELLMEAQKFEKAKSNNRYTEETSMLDRLNQQS